MPAFYGDEGLNSASNGARNRLLDVLDVAARERLLAGAERVTLGLHDPVHEAGEPISHVYFPLHGVLSLVIPFEDGSLTEVATIGNEGFAGTALVLGTDRAVTRCFSQVPGESLRVDAGHFRAEFAATPETRSLFQRYTQTMIDQLSHSAACNSAHPVERRACRWILMCHDRVSQGEITLTQEFLAEMLGVRRPTVSMVAGMLQKAGLISYSRGRIRVVDRAGLEAASCECYAAVRRAFDRLLTPASANPSTAR
jgi:CRP-like cAMP-binding protein